jgi:hypothetical protein
MKANFDIFLYVLEAFHVAIFFVKFPSLVMAIGEFQSPIYPCNLLLWCLVLVMENLLHLDHRFHMHSIASSSLAQSYCVCVSKFQLFVRNNFVLQCIFLSEGRRDQQCER